MIPDWEKLVNRVKSEVDYRLGNNNTGKGIVAVTLTMLMDCEGKPMVWTIDSKKVEPGSRAKDLLELL